MNSNESHSKGNFGQPINPSDAPEWAITFTSAALKTEMLVPDIEKRLVAKGLTPSIAAAIVEGVLAGRIRQSDSGQPGTNRWILANRILSSIVGFGYVLTAYLYVGPEFALKFGSVLILPLGCIWFGAEVTNYMMGKKPDAAPSFFIRFLGWLLLVLWGVIAVIVTGNQTA